MSFACTHIIDFLQATSLLQLLHSCSHFSPPHEISVKTHHLDDFEPHRPETKLSWHSCLLCLPDKKVPIKNLPGSPPFFSWIKIKSLSSKLCISGFLGSRRCFWCSQVTLWPGSISAPLPSHYFPKHMKSIHLHVLTSIPWAAFCLLETDLLKLTTSNLVEGKMYLGHK